MRHINEIKKLIQFPRTQIQLMFQKKTNSKKLFNSKLNIHHSTFKTQHSTFITQHSKLEVYMFSLIKVFLVITSTLVVLLTNLSCHRTPVEPEKTKVKLIYEDALCTEAYFRLKTTEINYPVRVDLYLNKDKVNSFTTFNDDTVFVIENLLPKKSYTSYVRIYPEGGKELVSSEVSFVTMDTTSHDFTWQVFEFGNCGNSVLFDVAIIDENNIWAVGEIYMRDSLGRCDPNAYNAVHWDGSKWELKKVSVIINNIEDTPTIRAICAFNEKDIWFGIASIIRWDGIRYNFVNTSSFFPALINKMWGNSSNDLYIVGNNGNIAHWDGRRWTKIESGTDINLRDIYGNNLSDDIYIVGNEYSSRLRNVLLRLKNGNVEKLWESYGLEGKEPYGKMIRNIYIKDNWLFAVGNRYTKENKKLEVKPKSLTNIQFGLINEHKGTDGNDIYTFTAISEIFHYNGISIERVFYHPSRKYIFYGGNVKGNIVVGVGSSLGGVYNRPAILVLGRKN